MRSVPSSITTLAFAAAMVSVAGCRGVGASGRESTIPFAGVQRGKVTIDPMHRTPLDKIKHIVIVIQENRTVENLFYDYPGAMTVKFGYGSKGQKIPIGQIPLATNWDFQHNSTTFFQSCNGTGKIPGTKCRMNGFDQEYWQCGKPGHAKCHLKYPPYSYVPHNQVLPYLDMAKQYVLAAQMFASNFDISSFISHQYIIAGLNPNSSANYPTAGQWGCPGGPGNKTDKLEENRHITPPVVVPCWNLTTLGDELDNKNVSWAYYAAQVKATGGKNCGKQNPDVYKGIAGIWSAYEAVKHICYGRDWDKDVISPSSNFLKDVKAGNLRSVTWVTPRYSDSDHPGNRSDRGPSWVASVVNAVGESPFWDSTAIFIFWDDPGGLYDPVPPPYSDNDGLGFRLPLLIISPYAKPGWVSQVQYEHGSILKFIEDRFGLMRLTKRGSDMRANSPEKDCFDFSKPPRKFVPIKAKYPASYFLDAAPDDQSPDSD